MVLRSNKGKGNVSNRDEWQTPKWLFDILNNQYGFILDCCATSKNSKCTKYCPNFLESFLIWQGSKANSWMNPPFSKSKEMFKHFFKVIKKGVCIFRCDNMETKLWQDIILKNASWIFIPKGRINYEGMNGNGSVFPSALIGFNVLPPEKLEGTLLFTKGTYKST